MSTTGPKRPILKYPHIWLRLAGSTGIAAIGIVVLVIVGLVFFPMLLQSNGREPTPITTTTPQPGNVTIVREAFGPWHLVTSDQAARAPEVQMLMINGTVQLGSRRLHPTSDWHRAVAPELTDTFVRGDVIDVRTSYGKVFTVGYNQAFIFEDAPETVYAFRTNGQLVSTSSHNLITEG